MSKCPFYDPGEPMKREPECQLDWSELEDCTICPVGILEGALAHLREQRDSLFARNNELLERSRRVEAEVEAYRGWLANANAKADAFRDDYEDEAQKREEAEAELERIITCPSCRTTHYACDCGIAARVQLEKEAKTLRKRVEKLEKALRFYAEGYWPDGYPGGVMESKGDTIIDTGETARWALEDLKK